MLTSKGSKLIQAKVEHKTLTKAFDALKYQTISSRISNEYIRLKQNELKQRTLRFWAIRFNQVRDQKHALAPLVKRRHLCTLAESLRLWKREVFGARFVETLQVNLFIPRQVRAAIVLFKKWKRYSKMKSLVS